MMMMTVIRLHTHTLNHIKNKHTAARTASIIAKPIDHSLNAASHLILSIFCVLHTVLLINIIKIREMNDHHLLSSS